MSSSQEYLQAASPVPSCCSEAPFLSFWEKNSFWILAAPLGCCGSQCTCKDLWTFFDLFCLPGRCTELLFSPAILPAPGGVKWSFCACWKEFSENIEFLPLQLNSIVNTVNLWWGGEKRMVKKKYLTTVWIIHKAGTFVSIYPMVSRRGFGSVSMLVCVCLFVLFLYWNDVCRLKSQFRLKSLLSLYYKELWMKMKWLVSWYTNEVRISNALCFPAWTGRKWNGRGSSDMVFMTGENSA